MGMYKQDNKNFTLIHFKYREAKSPQEISNFLERMTGVFQQCSLVTDWTVVSASLLCMSWVLRVFFGLVQSLFQFCIAVRPLLKRSPQAAVLLHVLLFDQLQHDALKICSKFAILDTSIISSFFEPCVVSN